MNIIEFSDKYKDEAACVDFFYDGGSQVRPSEHQSYLNLRAISEFLKSKSNEADFIFIQEIDSVAKRSYGMNQVDTLKNRLGFQSYFWKNYSVAWVLFLCLSQWVALRVE